MVLARKCKEVRGEERQENAENKKQRSHAQKREEPEVMKDKRKNKNVEEMQDGDQCIDKQCQVGQNVKPKITTHVVVVMLP